MTVSLVRVPARKNQRLSAAYLHLLAAGLMIAAFTPRTCHGAEADMQALVLGGSFEKPPVKRFLPGARKTILFPALLGKHGTIVPIGKGKRWENLVSDSLERAALIMTTTDPLLVRDSRGVLQMAIINSDSPLLATGVLTKGFLNRFSAQFGPELIVAVPARNKVYVFPKLANRLPDASREIRDDYLISPMPVSTEFFELSKKGLKAVGTVDPTDR